MQKIRLAGVSDPRITSSLMTMGNDAFLASINLFALRRQFPDTIECLKSTLQLNQEETDSILLSLPNSLSTGFAVEKTLDFLVSLADGNVERVNAAVLKQPDFLSLSVTEIEDRIDERRQSVHTTEDMIIIATMTDEDYQTYLSLEMLQKMLNFTQNEIDSILVGSRVMAWQNATHTLATKIDYLLTQGSKDNVKNAILSRPKLLSHPLEKIRSMSNVLVTKKSKYATLQFRNESQATLRDALGLAKKDADFIISHSRYLSLRDPDEFLLPKLNYLLSEFDGSKKHVASCVLSNPGLLDYSLCDLIMPRMKLLINAGLDPSQINDIISLRSSEINQRMELQTYLNLTDTELDRLIPMKSWLGQRGLRKSAELAIQYLASHLNGSIDDLKQILLEEPKLLTLSVLKTIQPRMDMLLDSGCPPADIRKIGLISQRKAEEFCSKCQLRTRLGFSSDQMDCLLASVSIRPSSSLIEKVDYLLQNVFGGSKQKLNSAILQHPALLKQSLKQTIQPRVEVLHYLESIGLGYQPIDIADFFALSDSGFTKELVPQAKNWYPPLSNDLDGRHRIEHTDNHITSGKDDILGILKEYSPTLALAFSDESNREGARVVHWR